MFKPTFLAPSLSGAALLLGACGQDAATPAAPEATTTPAAAPTAPVAAPAQGAANLWRSGEAAPLDVQVAHPNGVVLQLTSLQTRPTETVVGVRILNGDEREVQLNRFNNRQGYLVLDNGERLYLSPPAGNTRLIVQPGQTLEGELVFLGRIAQAGSAVLVLNENSSTDNRYTNTPGFRVNLDLASLAAGVAP